MILEDINWKGKTLLIAEDDYTNYKIVEQVLKKTGVNIIWAETGEEVLFFLKHPELHINAVLMDIRMPDLDGLEATLKLREKFPNLPVVMLSAYANNNADAELYSCFDACLSKPVKRDELLSTLSEYFGTALN